MSDPVRRAIRTYLDAFLGTFLGLWAASGLGVVSDDKFPGLADLEVIGKLAFAAALAAVPALLSYLKNELEDRSYLPAILKAPASDGGNPVPHH